MKEAWKIGELAEQTGLTVRALHHYESIGLLTPSKRAGNNYRIYEKSDVETLQRIITLKELGFTLEQIGQTLGGKGVSPLAIMEIQADALRGKMKAQARLLKRLDGFIRLLKSRKSPAAEDLLHAIRLAQITHAYHTDAQGEAIRKRGETLGRKGLVKAEGDWAALIAAVQAHMDKGTDPRGPAVKKLAKKWMALIDAFTGGDPKIAENLRKMYENEPAARHFGPSKEMGDYIRKALGK